MSMRYKGGVLSATPPTVTISSAPGLWTLEQQMQYQAAGTWPPAILPDPYFENVVALMHFDGTNGAQNNTFLDSSTNNLTITRNGNTTQGALSPFSRADGGWSNYFDGSGDYLSVANNAAFDFATGNFTVELWAYITSYAGGATDVIVSTYQNSTNGWTVGIFGTTSKIYFAVAGDSGQLDDPAALPLNQWVHIAAVRSGTTMSLFVNGARAATATNSTNNTSTSALTIGTNVGGGALSFNGYISSLRVVKGTAVYDPTQSTLTVPTAPLTAITNTSLLTCQSNRFKDNSTNAFAITPSGNTSVQVFNPFNPTAAYSTSTNGGSGYFDGSGDYLTVPDNAAFDFGTGDFTLETWVYITNAPDSTGQAIFGEINSGYEWYMYTRTSGNLEVGLQTFSGGYSQIYTTNNYVKANQWAHVAVARQSGTLRFFVNGLQCTTTGSMPATLNNGSTINIGRSTYNNANFIYGYISGLRVVKGTAVYTANFTPPTAPLTAISGTSFLMNFTNGAIFDNSASSNFETLNQAQLNTTTKKFGAASMACDGSYDGAIVYPTSPNYGFGLGDFTIEGWFYINAAVTARQPFIKIGTGGTSILQVLRTDGGYGYALGYLINSSAGVGAFSGYVPASETWNHIAVSRQGTNMRFFLNGVLAGTVTGSNDLGTANGLVIGYDENFSLGDRSLNGYADEVRITKGVARYTTNFTPPTAAFPNL